MVHANYFLDMLHVKKNMSSAIGSEKMRGLALYERAVFAAGRFIVDDIKTRYGEKQTSYLSKFPDSVLYRSYSTLKDSITTSQGAESQMMASLRNAIRTVEPQRMLARVVEVTVVIITQEKSRLKLASHLCLLELNNIWQS